jgi:mannose-6-phosphate isomerase
MTLYPFTFHPIFKERVWGGRSLEQLYGKPLPPNALIGESWEIADRPHDASVIANGPLAGRDLHWLVEHHREELLGTAEPLAGRFPLLIKILDAREKLSLQVHPPPEKAAQLGGEAKTEMWYIAEAAPGAELFAGLKRGVTRQDFEESIRTGTVAECFHRIAVRRGDALFLPSGRVHTIGAGLVVFEVQQNSDTTYRVFDWNRVGLEGKPRKLHVAESLESINFDDFEPMPIRGEFGTSAPGDARELVNDRLFRVELCQVNPSQALTLPPRRMQIIGVLSGRLQATSSDLELCLPAGQFCLVPASLDWLTLKAQGAAAFLRIEPGRP